MLDGTMKLSVVVITRNAEEFMYDCLDSLVNQSVKPMEVLVVDANSTDKTQDIVKEYSKKWDIVKLLEHPGTRGEGRNFGAKKAAGEIVAFMDADAIANALWVDEMTKAMENADVVAGKEVRLGYHGFTSLKRVGMLYNGVDISPCTVRIYL